MTRKKTRCRKNSMPSPAEAGATEWWLPLLALATAAMLGGCAGRPWGTALDGERLDQTRAAISSLDRDHGRCGQSLDGDLALFYSDPLGKTALSGYLQFSQPDAYKFVVANPLGQTVLAIAGNRRDYQAVNVFERLYSEGSMRSFGLRHDLPKEILEGAWGEWLTGASTRGADAISMIREDREGRGLWLSYDHRSPEPPGKTHMLWQPENGTVLMAVVDNGDGGTVAEIGYGQRLGEELCHQPQEIRISGLDYGVDIRLQLSAIRFQNDRKEYRLPIPRGYQQLYMP